MPSTLETIDKSTGSLGPKETINSEVTKAIAELGIYARLLPTDRAAEKVTIEGVRNHLCEIRNYLDDHFKYEPKAILTVATRHGGN